MLFSKSAHPFCFATVWGFCQGHKKLLLALYLRQIVLSSQASKPCSSIFPFYFAVQVRTNFADNLGIVSLHLLVTLFYSLLVYLSRPLYYWVGYKCMKYEVKLKAVFEFKIIWIHLKMLKTANPWSVFSVQFFPASILLCLPWVCPWPGL